jgi:hypothetical protein
MIQGDLSSALRFFDDATQYIETSGLSRELNWQRASSFENFTETQFLRESAWVILCSGFRESVVRRIFNHISLSFCDWESAQLIVESKSLCRSAALASFRNERKLDALLRTAEIIHWNGFCSFKEDILQDPIPRLQSLPYIGSITALHLAKNLGLNVAKPDRHLVRLSQQFGYACTANLCSDIARVTGEHVKVIDLVLWRYIADVRPTLQT